MNWIQNVLMPPLAKVGNNKYLVAVRNGLVMTLPAVISGSVFLIIGNIPIPAWTAFMKPTCLPSVWRLTDHLVLFHCYRRLGLAMNLPRI